MKKFKFSLQKVLEYNTHIQRKEKEILAELRAEYYELERKLEKLIQEYELNKLNYLTKCAKGTSITSVATMLRYIEVIEKRIQELKKIMAEKKLLIDKQIEKLVQVSKDKVTAEKLRDSKLEAYKTAERKSEENSIEEFISFINSTAN